MPSPPRSTAEQKLDARYGLDPFLIAHRTGKGEFNMSGKYSPAAVRDQINRAVAIVERAITAGVLTKSSRLLVKGCGAAGVSAAMQAVKRNVGSVTLSHNGPFFARQSRSKRIIDPVEYDWPAEGWANGTTPSTRVPLPYARGYARQIVATHWEPAWHEFRNAYEGKLLHIADSRSDEANPDRFQRILDCTGPGEERTNVGKYCWYQFWENDYLEEPNLGVEDHRPTVLISGGGDGALQDFLRILFPGKTPRDIYRGLQLLDADRLKVEWQIFNAEDRARRAWVWSADPEIDCGVLSQLHQAHRKVAAGLLPLVRTRLEVLLEQRTTDLDRIWLAHECNHFSPCYAFNRFLLLLVDEYCNSLRDVGTRLLNGRRLSAVSGHGCASIIEDCLSHPHQPHFDKWHCRMAVRDAAPAIPESEPVDIIVVRHGLTGQTRRLSRQSLPYELPALP